MKKLTFSPSHYLERIRLSLTPLEAPVQPVIDKIQIYAADIERLKVVGLAFQSLVDGVSAEGIGAKPYHKDEILALCENAVILVNEFQTKLGEI